MKTISKIHQSSMWIICLLTLSVFSGCETLDYRAVQAQFEVAAQADNNLSPSVFTEGSVFTDPGYQPVLDQLTDEFIAGLDSDLRANAWLLRGISEWRSMELTDALESANRGLESNPQEGSRDHVLLELLPALLFDSEIAIEVRNLNNGLSLDAYAQVKTKYESAFAKVEDAMDAFGPGTPASTQFYVHYHRWRMLQNWQQIIVDLDANGQQRAAQMREAASIFESATLDDEAEKAMLAIPPSQPLRQLIDAKKSS